MLRSSAVDSQAGGFGAGLVPSPQKEKKKSKKCDIHGYMCRPLLVRLNAHGVPAGATCTQNGGMISTDYKRVAIRVC